MPSASKTDTRFRVSEADAIDLALEFGTPLYVIDERHLRRRIRQYKAAFSSAYPNSELAYASKANSTLAILAIIHSEGCKIDVASEGELRAAIRAGIPAADCHLHGNNKSVQEITFAVEQGVGEIVVDNFPEIEELKKLGDLPKLILRLAPGVDPITHEKISTGQEETKFGFGIASGAAEEAVKLCLEAKLPLVGFHCHVGSQLVDPEAQRAGGEGIAQFARRMKEAHRFEAQILNVGGGLGVRYTDDEPDPMPVEDYCRLVVKAVTDALEGSGLEPTLIQEPGRALIAESGVTLYKVGVVKRAGKRTFVCVDGGLADNPRPALYGARYQVERISPQTQGELQTVTVSGRHCEGDELFANVRLPQDAERGDILQVLCTGAYGSSMASNYNRYPRPATVLIRESGERAVIQEQETWDQLFERERLPKDL